jgi:hypothetical protein
MKNCVQVLLRDQSTAIKSFVPSTNRKGLNDFQKTLLSLVFLFLFFASSSIVNAQVQITHLYLSDPGQSLDRVDPVATADNTTATSMRIFQTAPAISVDATTTGYSANPNANTFTVTHTTGTENNRLMLVGISDKNKIVNSVTYGGTPLTMVGESISNGNAHMHLYYLVNPPSGTADIIVYLNANPDKGIVVGVTTFSNVDQNTPLGTFASATVKSAAASVTVSSAAGELVYDVVSFRNATITVGSGQTALYNINSGGEVKGGGASTKPGAASVTMTWSGASSQDWAIGAVPIKPAPLVNLTYFVLSPSLCSAFTIKAGNTITVTNYITAVTGSMPANPNITAVLEYNGTNIITLTNPTYNSGTGLLTWTGTLGADLTVPAGEAIELDITNLQSGTSFRINYDSQTKPSKIALPTTTYVNVNSVNVYTAAYPGGSIVYSGLGGTTRYLRAVVTDPFGNADITSLNFTITPTGSSFAGTQVYSSGCMRVYEYVWAVPASQTSYTIAATAKQGYENLVTHTASSGYSVCLVCPPVALDDSASGSGGLPITVDALFNDYDPNNNINVATLSIITQPRNGTGYLSNGQIVYLPNGTYSGRDTLTYRICDLTSLCDTAQIFFTVNPLIADPCTDATLTHTYYLPYPEQDAYTALLASSNTTMPSNNIRTVISLTVPYPGMTIVWDEWEDGFETYPYNPVQSTTKVWGDGNLFNGIAPGYTNDIIPAGGSIVLDNTMPANPRLSANIFYDGRDKITSSGQIAVTQVCGEPTRMPVQAMKSNVTSVDNFGSSFTVPVGQNYPSQDFAYTALFIRASQNATTVNVDKDNNGTLETTINLNEGESYFLNGGVNTGATITSNLPVGVELNAGGIDGYSIRNAPIFPATWYSNTYYTPVPTSDNAGDSPKDTSVVMLYNSLNRSLTINWSSGAPGSGTINLPAKTTVRFPLAYSTTAAYKFVNPTGESFTAIEIVDSYTPGGGGNDGSTYDWSFNLIAESRLSEYATTAWAPGGLDLIAPVGPDVNGNPIWVTPTANTTVYVKYDGKISGNSGSVSPCGLRYDISYSLNALNYLKIRDPNDNDQSGIGVYTCDGVKLAVVYGEDPQGSLTGVGVAYWDVGTTIQPFCKSKLIFANDDYRTTLPNQPVTVPVLLNDFGFLATIDPATVTTIGLLQPLHGTVTVNADGTILYTPAAGYTGNDVFEYQVCSTPSPVVCDIAKVYIKISACPSNNNQNFISGQVFLDKNKDGVNNDNGTGFPGIKVYLYTDGNCNSTIDANELTDSVTVDSSGFYQFVKSPDKFVADDFDGAGGARTCANGTDGNTPWATDWVDAGDASVGYCNVSQSEANTDVEIKLDPGFSYGLRLKDKNKSATRTVNLSGATKAFLTFSYRRKNVTMVATHDVIVQVSSDGTIFNTVYTISGDGTTDANYVTIYNQDITAYASAATYIRFLTNNNLLDKDTVYIDNLKIQFQKYSQCYITKFDPASLPANYYMTTVTQRAMTFNSGGTCNSVQDFGLAKNNITLSGTLRNDKNGLKDGNINGTGTGAPEGITVYAYLVDNTGRVAFKTTVNAGSGAFSFSTVDVNTTYTLRLSTTNVALFATAPTTAAYPSNWGAMGDSYGTNNAAGSGIEAGTPNSAISIITASSNISTVEFGIERIPNSDNYTTAITHPGLNQVITLNGGVNPPVLSGPDPEDQPGGGVLTTRSLIVDTIPDNAELYYNNILVVNNQFIINFNPSQLKVKVTDATYGDSTITFNYSYVDTGGLKDPSPAYYRLAWFKPLPADGLVAQVSLTGVVAAVRWSTLSEQNTDYFVLERSLDNMSFAATGYTVRAAGNSVDKREYQEPDNVSNLLQYPVIYYRIKLVDIDGKFKYSNVVAVRLNKVSGITAWPNPFNSFITINIVASQNTELTIRLLDVAGRTLQTNTRQVTKGVSQLTLNELDQLAAGVYVLDVKDNNSGNKTEYKFIKEN